MLRSEIVTSRSTPLNRSKFIFVITILTLPELNKCCGWINIFPHSNQRCVHNFSHSLSVFNKPDEWVICMSYFVYLYQTACMRSGNVDSLCSEYGWICVTSFILQLNDITHKLFTNYWHLCLVPTYTLNINSIYQFNPI